MTITKRPDRPKPYLARVRTPSGERSKAFRRRQDAVAWERAQQGEITQGKWIDPQLGRMHLTEYVADHWAPLAMKQVRTRTWELNHGVLRNYVLPRFGDWPIAKITATSVKEMIADDIAAGLSSSAVRRHVIVLRQILDAAVDDGRLGQNPAKRVKLPPETSRDMRVLTPEQISSLADAIGDHYRPLVLTAAYGGLRWGELSGLAIESIDLLRKKVTVERQLQETSSGKLFFGPPKTKAGTRTVTLPSTLVDVLGLHFASNAVQTSRLAFPTVTGKPMRATNFRRVWRKACASAGLDADPATAGLVFHELRHTAAALAIQQGAHPMAIKERLGHSSITTTLDRYGHLFPSLDEAIADGLDDVFKGAAKSSSTDLSAPRGSTPSTVSHIDAPTFLMGANRA
ncbi:MAG: tyrosine-type recombinase/integrase [Acidimicrobiales bacterium]